MTGNFTHSASLILENEQQRAATSSNEQQRARRARAELRSHIQELLESAHANEIPAITYTMDNQPTIPTLTQVNYKQWQGIISDYALIRGHPNILTQEPPQHPSDPDGYAILQAQMRLTILSSIDSSIMARLPDDITTQAPYFIMRQISALLQADKSPEEHEFLRSKAESLTMQPDETIATYIQRHSELRLRMIRAEYPGIASESITTNFIIKGVSTNPQFAPHIPALLIQSPETVKACERNLLKLSTRTPFNAKAQRPTLQ